MATLVDLSEWLHGLTSKINLQQSELQQAAENQVRRIKNRTARGVGVDLQMFAPYSPNTKKKVALKANSFGAKLTAVAAATIVTLRETGEMMDSITVESTDTTAHIYFSDEVAKTKAAAHNAGTPRLPQRYFFGVSLNDREKIVGDVRKSVFRRVNQ